MCNKGVAQEKIENTSVVARGTSGLKSFLKLVQNAIASFWDSFGFKIFSKYNVVSPKV